MKHAWKYPNTGYWLEPKKKYFSQQESELAWERTLRVSKYPTE